MKNLYKIFVSYSLLLIALSGCELSFETVEIYDERDRFTGYYEVEEYSEGSSATFYYNLNIWKSSRRDGIIWIGNFYDCDITVFAEVGADRFYIPVQRTGNLEIEGRGTLYAGDELSISYSVREIQPGPDYVDFLNCRAWKHY